jgi:hypothetical protein
VRLDNVLHESSVVGKLASPFVGTNTQQADDHEAGDGGREVESDATSKDEGAHCGCEIVVRSAPDELHWAVRQGVTRDDEEDAHSDGSLVPQSQEGELPEVVVVFVGAPGLGNLEGLVGVVAEEDEKGGQATHAVEIGGWCQLGWTDLLTGMSALEETGDEEEKEASDQAPRGATKRRRRGQGGPRVPRSPSGQDW